MKFRRVVTFTRKLRFESSVISYGSKHLPHLPAPQAASKDIETCFLPCVSTQYIGNFFFDAVVGCVIGVKSPAVRIKSATIPSVTTGTFLLFSNFLNAVFNFCNIKNHPETILFGVIFLMPFIQKLSGKNLLNLIYHLHFRQNHLSLNLAFYFLLILI